MNLQAKTQWRPLVLVTGATGFIATHIIKQLLLQGYFVRGTVRVITDGTILRPLRDLGGDANKNLEFVQADLLNFACWSDIVKGCKYVIHTASPYPEQNPIREDDVFRPAVEGTLNVLQACVGKVSRVVLTSSVGAIDSGHETPANSYDFTEEEWGVAEKTNSIYKQSKMKAEKSAWDFVSSLPVDEKFELAVVNPSLVLGPLLSDRCSTSVNIVHKIMSKNVQLVPRLSSSIVDVRDVASAHIAAMESPLSPGKRHIVSGQQLWLKDIVSILAEEFNPLGYEILGITAPYPLLQLIGIFKKDVKNILPEIGHVVIYDNSSMIETLGIKPRPAKETILETARSLIEIGLIKKTEKYKMSMFKRE